MAIQKAQSQLTQIELALPLVWEIKHKNIIQAIGNIRGVTGDRKGVCCYASRSEIAGSIRAARIIGSRLAISPTPTNATGGARKLKASCPPTP